MRLHIRRVLSQSQEGLSGGADGGGGGGITGGHQAAKPAAHIYACNPSGSINDNGLPPT